jgi:hypothetical protein
MANESFTDLGGWDSTNLVQNNVIFIIFILATLLHFHLWLQLFIHKTKFDLSFIFSLSYISADIFLISFYFIQYGIRIRSWIPVTRSSCYFEAYSMFYFNLFESYCLTLLNICRYWQIVRNENAYKFHRRKVILISIIVLMLILLNLIIQDIFGWCILTEEAGASCSLSYTNNIVRIWNLTVVLALPILISFYMLTRAFHFLKNSHAQQAMVRRNHHHQLIIHSLIFYSIWLSLWLPLMIANFLDLDNINESLDFAFLVANTLEILADPVIVIFLDKRFAQAWKKFYQWIKQQFGGHKNARVHPTFQMAIIQQNNTLNHVPT